MATYKFSLKSFIIGISLGILILVSIAFGALADRVFGIKPLDYLAQRSGGRAIGTGTVEQKVLREESVVIDVAERVSPSVVTVSIEEDRKRVVEFSPFGGFRSRIEGGEPQDIGSGFVVSKDGLVVTNKHVVNSGSAKYKVITKDGKEYDVSQISKDPSNDIAVLKIQADNLQSVELGESNNLKVGQFVIAIGTALGEFRHTVTTGVVSGLGRGITAGGFYEGYVERLDDVIQTDAAINPGNSGGPLLNSAGQVIGINVAVASGAENIGFAIPVDIVKAALEEFNKTGSFASKPFLGVSFQMISKQTALMNDVVSGAYVADVVEGSPAEAAGIEVNDIITKFDGEDLKEDGRDLASVISKRKPGQTITIEVWRGGETKILTATLSEFSE